MSPLLRAYLILGMATFIASALMAAQLVISAPTTNYQVTVMTNSFGEGAFEAALLIFVLPAWFMLFRRIVTSI